MGALKPTDQSASQNHVRKSFPPNPNQRSITALDNKPGYIPSSHTAKVTNRNSVIGDELGKRTVDNQKNVPLALDNSRFNRASVDDLRLS